MNPILNKPKPQPLPPAEPADAAKPEDATAAPPASGEKMETE